MASTMDPGESYDLLILVDSTYSMEVYLRSLRLSLARIIPISTLTDCFSRIGVLAYKDYCDKDLLNWSGWLTPSAISEEPEVDLQQMVKNLQPFGGGDGPEATKTGLARAYELMREDATTIIFLYTDAEPHTFANGSVDDRGSCLGPELSALKIKESYGGFGPLFHDWVSAAKTLSGRTGKKKAQVFSFLAGIRVNDIARYYLYLCSMTGGACFLLGSTVPTNISKVTVEVLLAWMGAEKGGVSEYTTLPASLAMYNSVEGMTELRHETSRAAAKFFPIPKTWRAQKDTGITSYQVSLDVLKQHLPKKTTAVQPFAERYAADPRYRTIAVDKLRQIILDDVVAISYNPVFGSLWRAVCNDRENDAREEIIQAFGSAVDRITVTDEKARMRAWLEESYDYTAELLDAINSVPVEQQFPCVCLDPTLVFVPATTDDDDDDDDGNNDKEITSFRRDELLEIGRSCDYKVLRRLGRVLTRLTYINSRDELPTHISKAPEKDTPRIPLALATSEHKRQFWRVLLHLVVPGTKLSARPAALLAALSIRLGLNPLLEAATAEMLLWRDRWNNTDIPETWSVGCLSLLLDADKEYRAQRGGRDGPEKEKNNTESLLVPQDRELFELLVSYKMLELNMQTTLSARVGWTPTKATALLGPNIVCKSCEYPRSVTILGEDGKCGLCLVSDWESEEERLDRTNENVNKDDSDITPAVWVECSVRTCRAQYVVYNTQSLNVRPKCHYCRNNDEAPMVECSQCLSRMIWPTEYRPDNITDYTCHICKSGHKTIVEVETTASALLKENGESLWIRNDGKIKTPFNNRSLYHTISKCGVEDFCNKVELFPAPQENVTLAGKLVRNFQDVVQQLKSWVSGRRTELGTCSLCFTSKRKTDLMLACGRQGCHQRVCRECMEGWYGLNASGRIINTAALSCPFCRRAPTAQTLARYGMGIHAVVNLQAALDERGTWVYGWCHRCGTASRLMERVCAAGAPPEERDWICDHCRETVAEWGGKVELNVKECPGCKTMTEKTGGCNHIECSCGECWCFLCGEPFPRDKIYSHMSSDHGGWYGDGREYDSEEDDGDSDED